MNGRYFCILKGACLCRFEMLVYNHRRPTPSEALSYRSAIFSVVNKRVHYITEHAIFMNGAQCRIQMPFGTKLHCKKSNRSAQSIS